MTLLNYLLSYLIICILATFLLTRILALSKPLPDRRKYDRRKYPRPGHIDRRASYRLRDRLASQRNLVNNNHFSQ